MKRVLQVAAILVGAVVLICVIVLLLPSSQTSPSSKDDPGYGATTAFNSAHEPEKEAYSDQPVYPAEIAKNPFPLRGQTGILVTNQIQSVQTLGGHKFTLPYPAGVLKFERMLDEETAVFDVYQWGYDGAESVGELAVFVSDKQPPEPSRRWRVKVEGQMEATNGYGASINVSTVRFLGYAPVPPPPQAVQQEAPAVAPDTTPPAEAPDRTPAIRTPNASPDPSSEGQQPAAPIVREAPGSSKSNSQDVSKPKQ